MNKLKSGVLLLIFILVITATACGQKTTAQSPEQTQTGGEVIISAAASLKDAMEEIKIAFAVENPNTEIVYNFGGSGSLQKQIEQGAPADVFISAGQKQMTALKDGGFLIDDTLVDLLGNNVVLIASKETAELKDFEGLKSSLVKSVSVGDPGSVPAGQYGVEALKSMNIYESIKEKFVYAKDVKEVVAWVSTGNADSGIVYKTDAALLGDVVIVAQAPEDTHTPIVYPASVLKSTKNMGAAVEFMNFLRSAEAKEIFEKYGFAFLIG